MDPCYRALVRLFQKEESLRIRRNIIGQLQHIDVMRVRRATVEHPFGTIKSWMGSTHFSMKTLSRVSTEMSLHVLAYNLKRVINLIGTRQLIAAIEA